MAGKNVFESLLERLKTISQEGTLDGSDADRRDNLHRLFMYPAMMVPKTQTAIIEAIATCLPPNSYAIDPFVGSGTSLMSCMEKGYNVFGQDINPFAVLLSKAKATKYDMNGFLCSFEKVKNRIEQDSEETIDVNFNNIDKWFNKDVQVSLSKIRRAIIQETDIRYRNFFWVIMSEVIRIGSNDRTSTFKLHQRSSKDIARRKIDIIKEFFHLAERGISDLQFYKDKLAEGNLIIDDWYAGKVRIVWGNTQKAIETEDKFDLLVSSPPYGDNHTTVTYGQTCYLPLQWIDHNDLDCPYDYLKTTQEIDRQSLGGRINSKGILEKAVKLFAKSDSLKYFFSSLEEKDKFKYYKTISFIADFDECLDKIIASMKPDAFYIWTIGNRFVNGREVPNSKILIDLMEHRGINLFYTAERQILNKKQAKKNSCSKTMEKEMIVIFHNN